MLTHFGVDLLAVEWNECVVCVGTFDGVHLGHQDVIKRAVSKAKEAEMPCALVTFDRHPAATLAPDRCPPLIATLEQNQAVFRSLGVGICVILRFDSELAAMTADHFLADILRARLRAEHVVVGHDFAMGHDRVGNTAWLAKRVDTSIIPPFELDGRRVSSSAVRLAVTEGDVAGAAHLLGRPFAMSGVVVSGQKLGRKLGYPTANLARSREQVVPQYGVYAGYADTPLGRYRAAMSVGLRPTVDGKSRTIEAFLLDYPGDSIYGAGVEFHFVKRLRDEVAFNGLEELKSQMALDVIETAKLPLE